MSATEQLKFTLELVDQVSAPAKKVTAALKEVEKAEERVKKAGKTDQDRAMDQLARASGSRRSASRARLGRSMDGFAQEQNRAASSSRNWGAMAAGAFMAVGAAAIAAAAAVGRITIALGESMVAAADWRNRVEGGFRVLLGDRPALVGQAFQRASQYAQRFGLDVRDVARQMTQLTAANFSQSEIPRVMQAAGDLGALEGPQAAERAITAIRQIRAKGVLQMEELSGQLADAGLSVGDVVSEIGRMRGLRGDETAVGNQVRALITGRKVNAQQGIDAVLAVIARRSGGRLGGTLDTQSRGAEASINRLKNAWLILQSNFARSPAFARIIAFIERMAAALDPANASAGRFSAHLDRFFTVLTGVAARVDPVAVFNGIVSALGAIGRGLQAAYPYAQAWITGFYGPVVASLRTAVPLLSRWFGALFGGTRGGSDSVRALATAFGVGASLIIGVITRVAMAVGVVARVLSVPLAILGSFYGQFVAAFSGVELTFSGIGTAIVNGLKNGLTAAWGALVAQLRNLAGMLPAVVREKLGIRSPSRVFAALGGYVADGFAVGIEGGTSGVRGAVSGMVNVGAIGAAAASRARAGGGPLALTINVTAPEGSDADEWGAAIASAVARELGTRTERAL